LADGSNTLETLHYDGDNRWSQLNPDGNQINFFFGEDIDTNLAESSNGGLNWFLLSHQKSTVGSVDNNNTVTSSRQYDSFGNNFGDSLSLSDFGFTGREYFPSTDQYYFRSRFYQPDIGRFVSEDQIGFEGNDTNLYRFLGNNPTVGTDPFGEQSVTETVLLVGSITLAAVVGREAVCLNQVPGENLDPLLCEDFGLSGLRPIIDLTGNSGLPSVGSVANKARSLLIRIGSLIRDSIP